VTLQAELEQELKRLESEDKKSFRNLKPEVVKLIRRAKVVVDALERARFAKKQLVEFDERIRTFQRTAQSEVRRLSEADARAVIEQKKRAVAQYWQSKKNDVLPALNHVVSSAFLKAKDDLKRDGEAMFARLRGLPVGRGESDRDFLNRIASSVESIAKSTDDFIASAKNVLKNIELFYQQFKKELDWLNSVRNEFAGVSWFDEGVKFNSDQINDFLKQVKSIETIVTDYLTALVDFKNGRLSKAVSFIDSIKKLGVTKIDRERIESGFSDLVKSFNVVNKGNYGSFSTYVVSVNNYLNKRSEVLGDNVAIFKKKYVDLKGENNAALLNKKLAEQKEILQALQSQVDDISESFEESDAWRERAGKSVIDIETKLKKTSIEIDAQHARLEAEGLEYETKRAINELKSIEKQLKANKQLLFGLGEYVRKNKERFEVVENEVIALAGQFGIIEQAISQKVVDRARSILEEKIEPGIEKVQRELADLKFNLVVEEFSKWESAFGNALVVINEQLNKIEEFIESRLSASSGGRHFVNAVERESFHRETEEGLEGLRGLGRGGNASTGDASEWV